MKEDKSKDVMELNQKANPTNVVKKEVPLEAIFKRIGALVFETETLASENEILKKRVRDLEEALKKISVAKN
jgi:hypothetical protein